MQEFMIKIVTSSGLEIKLLTRTSALKHRNQEYTKLKSKTQKRVRQKRVQRLQKVNALIVKQLSVEWAEFNNFLFF